MAALETDAGLWATLWKMLAGVLSAGILACFGWIFRTSGQLAALQTELAEARRRREELLERIAAMEERINAMSEDVAFMRGCWEQKRRGE